MKKTPVEHPEITGLISDSKANRQRNYEAPFTVIPFALKGLWFLFIGIIGVTILGSFSLDSGPIGVTVQVTQSLIYTAFLNGLTDGPEIAETAARAIVTIWCKIFSLLLGLGFVTWTLPIELLVGPVLFLSVLLPTFMLTTVVAYLALGALALGG